MTGAVAAISGQKIRTIWRQRQGQSSLEAPVIKKMGKLRRTLRLVDYSHETIAAAEPEGF